MAKSARASVKKANRAKLRSRVFGPAEDARLARMEKKLMDLASQPKPERPEEMEIDVGTSTRQEKNKTDAVGADGDVDMDDEPTATVSGNKPKSPSNKAAKVQKRKHRKGSTSITFPVHRKGRKVTIGGDKKKKK